MADLRAATIGIGSAIWAREGEVRVLLDFNAVQRMQVEAENLRRVARLQWRCVRERSMVRCAHVFSGVARERLFHAYREALPDRGIESQGFACMLEALYWLRIPSFRLGMHQASEDLAMSASA